MKNLVLALLCLCCVGCDNDYSGSVKANTTAGKVNSIEVRLPSSSTTVVLKKKETVHKLILELEEITKQLRDAEERMPQEEE